MKYILPNNSLKSEVLIYNQYESDIFISRLMNDVVVNQRVEKKCKLLLVSHEPTVNLWYTK